MIIRGVVISGRSLGRKLGFPTANIHLEDREDIENGVYSSVALVDGVEYRAVSNVGVKPTVGSSQRALECHILNYEGDLYGHQIEVRLLEKLRDERKFGSVEELRRQIEQDIELVKLKFK